MDVFQNVRKQIEQVSEVIKISKDEQDYLLEPKKIIHVNFPVKMDSGIIRRFTGFRVQFNDAKGPTKGGIRFHPDVNLSEVKSLAFWMTIKNSVVGIWWGKRRSDCQS